MVKTYTKPAMTGRPARSIQRSDGLIEYRDKETNALLFLYDPSRRIVQIQKDGKRSRIPLDNPA